ncbi:STAS domain-containing protein [Streptomyces sp. NPDC089799]|uniref:STAS domain-containing protein n=1 Tax=Streptomyces sp. NPDC089799 TaxID=3155066 RepID=UPI00341AC77D
MPAENEQGATTMAGDPRNTALEVQVRRTPDGAAVCSLSGDLDIESLAPAQESLTVLLGQNPPVLVADLQGIGFCDSSGLNLLLKTRAAALGAGIEFRLAAAAPAVMRVLELSGAQAVFSLHPSVDAALTG